MKRLATALVVASWSASLVMAQEPADRLAAAMEPIRASGYTLAQEQKVLETAVDGGSAVVSYLESVLAGSDTARRIVALKALAYIGGDSAIAALRSEYRKRPDGWTTTFLCYAVASRGNREDQDLLLRTLADRTRKPDVTSPALLPYCRWASFELHRRCRRWSVSSRKSPAPAQPQSLRWCWTG